MTECRHGLRTAGIALAAVLGFTWSAPRAQAEPVTFAAILVAKGFAYLFGAAKVAGAAKGGVAAGAMAKGTVAQGTSKAVAAAAASKGAMAVSLSPMSAASRALFKAQTVNLAPRLSITNVSKGAVNVGNFSVPIGRITLALGGLGLMSGEAQAFNKQVISEIAAAAELNQPYHVKICREKDGNMYALPSRGEVCMDGSSPLVLELPLDAPALAR